MSQQMYLPLGDKYPIPHEFEANTMPGPRDTVLHFTNEMENGYTERHFMGPTHLTEPQGKIKNYRIVSHSKVHH